MTLTFIHRTHERGKRNGAYLGSVPYNLNLRWWLPEGFTVEGKKSTLLYHTISREGSPGRVPYKDIRCVIRAGEQVNAINRLVLEVMTDGRPTAVYVPLQLLG